ncbi:MAG: helix-turn-helix domain-containing protein [Pseudomonadota bacterium]
MLFWDSIIRYPAVTLLVLLALLAIRDARHLVQGRIVIVLGLTLGSMLLSTAPPETRPPSPLYEGLRLIDTANVVFVWWFSLSIFQDDFKLRTFHWLTLGAYLGIAMPARVVYLYGDFDLPFIFEVAVRTISIGMVAHLLWVALSGLRDDLIEVRRKTRLWYAIAMSVATALVVLGEMFYTSLTGDNSDPPSLSLIRSAIILPPILIGAFLYLGLKQEALLFERQREMAPLEPRIDLKDRATHTRLVALMGEEKLYREHGLGIGNLASKLSVPEHQLRALINKGLGYRNFAAFLNQYRLAEAKAALADPEQARTPILTIAMDVGYASLATFNRAFKTEEGLTPSAYRSEALTSAAQS